MSIVNAFLQIKIEFFVIILSVLGLGLFWGQGLGLVLDKTLIDYLCTCDAYKEDSVLSTQHITHYMMTRIIRGVSAWA